MERLVCPKGQLGCCCQQAQVYSLMGALGNMGLQHWSAAWLVSAAKTPSGGSASPTVPTPQAAR